MEKGPHPPGAQEGDLRESLNDLRKFSVEEDTRAITQAQGARTSSCAGSLRACLVAHELGDIKAKC